MRGQQNAPRYPLWVDRPAARSAVWPSAATRASIQPRAPARAAPPTAAPACCLAAAGSKRFIAAPAAAAAASAAGGWATLQRLRLSGAAAAPRTVSRGIRASLQVRGTAYRHCVRDNLLPGPGRLLAAGCAPRRVIFSASPRDDQCGRGCRRPRLATCVAPRGRLAPAEGSVCTEKKKLHLLDRLRAAAGAPLAAPRAAPTPLY